MMNSTLVWRAAVVAVLIAAVPICLSSFEKRHRVDTEDMLDVSVSVRTFSHVRTDQFGDSVWETGVGSGFVVSLEDCRVWTNHHVIEDAALVEIFPRGWHHISGISATVVSSNPRFDLAILEMAHCDGLQAARLGNSDTLRPGTAIYAVGNPLGKNPDSVSGGIVSHTERYLSGAAPYIQTDARINPGNSGGALFNRDGQVVGINTALAASRRGGHLGIGYAVPINLAVAAAATLDDGHPSWGSAGIEDMVTGLTPDEAAIFRVPDEHGAIILTETPQEGPGTGRLSVHDVIYRINDVGVADADQAMRLIAAHPPGVTLEFHLIRDGASLVVPITLSEGWKKKDTPSAEYFAGYLGLGLEMWSDRKGVQGRFTTPVITKVHSLGPAHKAHIASSQRSIAIRGPYATPYVLDVKTITGVVFDGVYYPVQTLNEINYLSRKAFDEQADLLLEVAFWTRRNPRNPEAALELSSTGFFRLTPSPSSVVLRAEEPHPVPPHYVDESDARFLTDAVVTVNP